MSKERDLNPMRGEHQSKGGPKGRQNPAKRGSLWEKASLGGRGGGSEPRLMQLNFHMMQVGRGAGTSGLTYPPDRQHTHTSNRVTW